MSQLPRNPKPSSNLETDALKIKIAKGVIELALDSDVTEIPDSLIQAAGRKALANHFNFYLQDSGDEVYISADLIDSKEPFERDGLISAILGLREVVEQTYTFGEGVSVEKTAKRLHKMGFQFDEKQQNSVEKKFTARIKKALGLGGAKGDFNKKTKKDKKPPGNGGDFGGKRGPGGGFDGGFGGNRGPSSGGSGCFGTGPGKSGW